MGRIDDRTSVNREAVPASSPMLPQATLGDRQTPRSQPCQGCAVITRHPSVAAKRGNPGLCCITASRYSIL